MTVPSRMNAEGNMQPTGEWLERSGCTFNVFQHKTKPALFCAVPVDQPVPVFILWEQWAFDQSLHPLDPCPPGFHPQAAQDGPGSMISTCSRLPANTPHKLSSP
jgi:hypothetical protein